MFLLAHTEPCRASEVASTLGIAGVLGLLLFRPWRRKAGQRRVRAYALPLVLAAAVTVGACSGDKKADDPGPRPSTPVKIAIESPQASETTGPDIVVRIRLDGGRVVQRTSGDLTPTDGHIHVELDGKLISMQYETTQDMKGLTPGPHTITAEFVAVDHAPFSNRPRATVLFTAAAP